MCLNQENRNCCKYLKWGEGVFIYGIGVYGDGRAEEADRKVPPPPGWKEGKGGGGGDTAAQGPGPRASRNHSSPVQ